MKVSDLVEFKADLFFGGAVQTDWFYEDSERTIQAASSFVFHGPKYHGVQNSPEFDEHRLTDTATFVDRLVDSIFDQENPEPIALAVAGYGTGKSHLALTMAALLRKANSQLTESILKNLTEADAEIGSRVAHSLSTQKPSLVVVLNGMKDFNLASNLSRQVLSAVEEAGLSSQTLKDLWPRFTIASDFCRRNFDVRSEQFRKAFGNQTLEDLEKSLAMHSEQTYELVNEIYRQTVGTYINAVGQETPQELLRTVVQEYCGDSGYFSGVVILFDEFGRYLEFAAQRPQLAGDAAIQQLFEGVQNNRAECSLVCFNQYELRAYLSRIASELQLTLQRYVTRFDAARKFYLSSNLETLFAHLLLKKDVTYLESYLGQPVFNRALQEKQTLICGVLNKGRDEAVWNDSGLFQRVIVQGCWPLDPIAAWVLANVGGILQNRSAIAIMKNTLSSIDDEIDFGGLFSVSAARIAENGLVEEFIANERFGLAGSEAEAYTIISNKLGGSMSIEQRSVLVSVLLFNKLHVAVGDELAAVSALSGFAGFPTEVTSGCLECLRSEHGVVEWNPAQRKYDLISDAVPRSRFTNFLSRRAQTIETNRIEAIFSSNAIDWCRLQPPVSSFSNKNHIGTTEWAYTLSTCSVGNLGQTITRLFNDWLSAVEPNSARGAMILCFVPQRSSLDGVAREVYHLVSEYPDTKDHALSEFPFFVVPIHDDGGELEKSLGEFFVLTGDIPKDETSKFRHFIEDHRSFLRDELPRIMDILLRAGRHSAAFHPSVGKEMSQIPPRKHPDFLFEQIYSSVIPFPFDGFSTLKGNAAKDCREMTIQLVQGDTSSEWLLTKSTQFQNRFESLLGPSSSESGSWQFIDQRGLLKLLPENKRVKAIVENLEAELEEKGEVSVRRLLFDWFRPPYGMNIASGGILLAAFIASRSETLSIESNGKAVGRTVWLSSVMGKTFIDLSKIGDTKLKLLERGQIDEWKHLLERWDVTRRISECLSLENAAWELETRIGLPPESLQYKREMLIERNSGARKQLSDNRAILNDFSEKYERSLEHGDAGGLVFLCQRVSDVIDTMKSEKDIWSPDEISQFEELLRESESAIEPCFDSWLDRLYVGNVAQLDKFERRNNSNARTLHKLGKPELARRLERKTSQLTKNLNEQRETSRVFEVVDVFRRTQYFTTSTPVEEIETIMRNAKDLISDLQKAQNTTNQAAVGARINKIENDYLAKGAQLKATYSDRLSKYFEVTKFATLEEIRHAADELENLRSVYKGKTGDIEDIDTILAQVRLLENAAEFLDLEMHRMSQDALRRNLKELEREYNIRLEEDSETVLDFWATMEPIFSHCAEKMSVLSANWMQDNIEGQDVQSFGFAACREFLGRISNIPPYLTEAHRRAVSEVNIAVQDRLSTFKLESIVQQFSELDHDQQEHCLKKLSRIASEHDS